MNPIVDEDLERIRAAEPSPALRGAVIVITGCAGFLGFYLMQFLVGSARSLGIRKVIGLDTFLLEKPAWLGSLQREHPDVLELRTFDISRDRLDSVTGAEVANFVVHMASIASPTFYRKYPVETIDANIWGLRHLLDHYKESNELRGLLFFSSSEIYGDPAPNQIPTKESYRGNTASIGPRACYDESKRFGETLCYVFSERYGMPITIARPFNNYGPGMRLGDRRLPADFAKCVVEGRDIEILSDGSPTRTFCYVTDAIAGYLKCLQHGRFDYFNIGTERPEITVRDLAEIYRKAADDVFGHKIAARLSKSPDENYLVDNPNRRCPDIAKARQTLGYEPRIGVAEGVSRYLRFLKHSVG
jgi:UDP-glucuronate decarboxylase